ncbi:non-structural protein 1a [Water buffalo astrovirus]|nr:non-structural protein 1a [Water buffalo astrovirus]
MNTYDKVLRLGSNKARVKAQALDKLSNNHLKDLFGDVGPVAYGFGPLDLIDPTTVKPELRHLDTVYAAAVVEGNSYVCYHFVPGPNKWVEVEAEVHQQAALVGVLYQEHKRVSRELEALRSEHAQLKMEHEILRHDYERALAKIPTATFRPFKLTNILFCAFILGLCFAGIASGQRPGVCYAFNEAGECEFWEWSAEPNVNYLALARTYVQECIDYFFSPHLKATLHSLMPLLLNWYICAALVAVYYLFRSEQPLYMFFTLILATFSRFQMVALALIPHLDFSATVSLWAIMGIFFFEEPLALFTSLVVFLFSLVVGLFLQDSEYAILVKGHVLVFCATCFSHVVHVLDLPPWVATVILITVKVWRAFIYVLGERIEIRSPEGKVLTVKSTQPSWLARASRFVQSFRQKIRTGVTPTARVIPNALVQVESKDGVGTGFRVQNYIVTAKHVVADDTQVKVIWGGVEAYTRVVPLTTIKDLALLALPPQMQDLPTYKFAKNRSDGPVVITAFDDDGLLLVAVTEGVIVDDHWTYAVATRNGMSGAPVTNIDGRVVGLHTSNTGFTGGAILFSSEDLPTVVKGPTAKEKELAAKVAELEAVVASMTQSTRSKTTDLDLVELVREAVGREMRVLRKEVSNMYSQAKGKNKARKRAKGKVGKVWSEEEYNAMLEKGFTREQLRDIAETIRQKYYQDDDSDEEVEAGYPQWSDPDISEDEINAEWFDSYDQSWKLLEPKQQAQPVNTLPQHVEAKYSLEGYPISKEDLKAVAKEIHYYESELGKILEESLTDGGAWAANVKAEEVLARLESLWYCLNHTLWEHGLMPFTQRKRRPVKTKNSRGAQKTRAPKSAN